MHQKLVVLCISLRYTWGKTINRFYKYIYWVSSIFIILSMMMIVVILSVMNGFEQEIKKNTLYFIPHAIITASKGYTHIDDQTSNFLLSNKNIKYVKPVIISNVILQSAQKISLGVMFGVNPKHFDPLFNYLIYNKIDQLIPGKYYIIIGSALAKRLSVQINDQIRLTIPSVNQMTPIGSFPSQRLCTILDFYTANYEIDNYQILIHQDDAAKLMRYPLQHITGWRIWLDNPIKINQFNNQFNISEEWNWEDWSKYKKSLFQALKMEKNIMYLLFFLIVMSAGFNIISFMILLITDKKKEIAILKTYGLTRLSIIMIFMIQSLFNSIFSSLIGTVFGIIFSNKINQILFSLRCFPKILQFPVEIQYLQILIINLIMCILVIFATCYSAWYVSAIQPAQVLHYDQKN